ARLDRFRPEERDVAVDLLVIERSGEMPELVLEDAEERRRREQRRRPADHRAVEHDEALGERAEVVLERQRTEEAQHAALTGDGAVAVEDDRILERRVVSVDELAEVRGSDVNGLAGAGIAYRTAVHELDVGGGDIRELSEDPFREVHGLRVRQRTERALI